MTEVPEDMKEIFAQRSIPQKALASANSSSSNQIDTMVNMQNEMAITQAPQIDQLSVQQLLQAKKSTVY